MIVSYEVALVSLIVCCIGIGYILGYITGRGKVRVITHIHPLIEMVSHGHIKHLWFCKKCNKYYNEKGREVKGWLNGKEFYGD